MPSLISSLRGAVAHALWYLDWRTGGAAVLHAGARGTT